MGNMRTSWKVINGVPVFVYTSFIDHFVFNVRVKKGSYQGIDAPVKGPSVKTPVWFRFRCVGKAAHYQAANEAYKKAEKLMEREHMAEQREQVIVKKKRKKRSQVLSIEMISYLTDIHLIGYGECDVPLGEDTVRVLLEEELLSKGNRGHVLTERGRAYIEKLEQLRLPRQVWI